MLAVGAKWYPLFYDNDFFTVLANPNDRNVHLASPPLLDRLGHRVGHVGNQHMPMAGVDANASAPLPLAHYLFRPPPRVSGHGSPR
jgi:hypothetical protein